MTGKLKTKGNMMFATKLDGVLKVWAARPSDILIRSLFGSRLLRRRPSCNLTHPHISGPLYIIYDPFHGYLELSCSEMVICVNEERTNAKWGLRLLSNYDANENMRESRKTHPKAISLKHATEESALPPWCLLLHIRTKRSKAVELFHDLQTKGLVW